MSLDFCINDEIYIKNEQFDEPFLELANELHEEIDIKSETFEEHDAEFDGNETFGQNTTLSGNEVDTDNIEIGVEDVKTFEFVEMETESLLAEPDNSLTCGKCNVIFENLSVLNYHLLTHADLRPISCPVCLRNFTERGHLNSHLLKIHNLVENSVGSFVPTTSHKCETCHLIFKSNYRLQQHINHVHKGLKTFKCDECGACFKQKSHLNSHLMIHTDERPYKCSICSRDFKWKNSLKKHLNKVHKIVVTADLLQKREPTVPVIINDKKMQIVCKKCDVQFSSHENLSQHVCIIQDNVKIETFEEQDTEFDSNVTFRQNTTLSGNEMDTNNIEIGVEDVKPFEIVEVKTESLLAEPVTDNSLTCGKCNAMFESRSSLDSHLHVHTKFKPFTCPECIKKFRKRFHLKHHLLKVHKLNENSVASLLQDKYIKSHICKKCGLIFKTQYDLTSHMYSIHKELSIDRPFKCNVCGLCFKRKCHLNSHSTTHSNEKTYKCSICSRDFKWKNNLKHHLNKVHKIVVTSKFIQKQPAVCMPAFIDDKEHTVCEICNVQFISCENLSQHVCIIGGNVEIETVEEHVNDYEINEYFIDGNEINKDNIEIGVEDVKPFKLVEMETDPLLAEPVTEISLTCGKCNATFTSHSSLDDHLLVHVPQFAAYKIVQNKEPAIIDQKEHKFCKKCNVQFSSHENLSQHVCIIQDNVKVEPFEEHDTEIDSNKTFGQNTTLSGNEMDTDNIEIGVEDVKPFEIVEMETESLLAEPDISLTCGMSNEEFSSHENLQQHKLIFHDGVIKCAICHATFTSEASLNAHLEIHSFNHEFEGMNNYNSHLLSFINSVVLPPTKKKKQILHYKCKTCHIIFKSDDALKKHIKIFHQDSKPFKCSICSEDFRLKYTLKQHFSKVHCINYNSNIQQIEKLSNSSSELQRHNINIQDKANLTSYGPPKPQLRQSRTRNEVRQTECKLTASSLPEMWITKVKPCFVRLDRGEVRQPDCKLITSSFPEMWITKVKPCCVRLDRGEVTRYLSRLDKREVTEERGSPIEGLPPPLATPAPPVRDDPRHPCGAVSVTSNLLLGAATFTLENVRQKHDFFS